MERRLNLGCGQSPLRDHVNVDLPSCPRADLHHDLREFPWPLPDDHFVEVQMQNVLEHLPNPVQTLEEIWRVCMPNAKVTIRVPYWNGRWAWMDMQHVRGFHENCLDFFDPSKPLCREYPHYSHARFHIGSVTFSGCWIWMAFPWTFTAPQNRPSRLMHLASRVPDMINFLEFNLEVMK